MIPENMEIRAEEGYCLPAIMEILLKTFGYNDMDQWTIAQKLCELTRQDVSSFAKDGVIIKPDTLNAFFLRQGFKLHAQYTPFTEIYDEFAFECRLKNQCAQDSFVFCGYNYSWLFNKRNGTANHVSAICAVDSEFGKVVMFDPGPSNWGYKTVTIEDLWYALKVAQAGIWCIKHSKN